MTDPSRGRIPALDGLRAVAVAVVVVHHLWPDAAPGGFVGVSIFFTLSGFVIARRLIGESATSGRIDPVAFWARRARRLLPAAVVTIGLVAVVWRATGRLTRSIEGDLLASIGQVANWRFIVTGREYGADRESPVAHFWSLAIEEQFYLLVPILFIALAGRRRRLVLLLAAVVLAAVVMTVTWSEDPSLVYYSTPTRAGEIALGALLAVTVSRRAPERGSSSLGDILGIGALVVVGVASIIGDLSQDIWYRGGLAAFGAVSCVLIIGALRGRAVAHVLSRKPIVRIGALSYAIYLVHWPVDLLVRSEVPSGQGRPWLSLFGTAVSAVALHRVVETPILSGRIRPRPLMAAAATTVVAVVALVVIPGGRDSDGDVIDYEAARENFDLVTDRPSPGTSGGRDIVRVGIFGDSTALLLSTGFEDRNSEVSFVTGYAVPGCTLGRGGRVRGDPTVADSRSLGAVRVPDRCDWTTRWADTMRRRPVDVAVVLIGNWDLMEREVPSLGGWRTIGDATYERWLAEEVRTATEALLVGGARVVAWLSLPTPSGLSDGSSAARLNSLIAGAVEDVPGAVVLDYAGHLDSAGDDSTMRPDGTHLSTVTAPILVRRWLAPEVTSLVTDS